MPIRSKAAVAVNSALIEFYWNLGKDISERYPGKVRDAKFYKRLSVDLKSSIPEAGGLSVSNLKYMRYFYALYAYRQQVVDDIKTGSARYRQQVVDDKELSEVAAELIFILWGHHINIIDYELKKVLPTQAQLAKCYADAEAQFAASAPCKVKRCGRK